MRLEFTREHALSKLHDELLAAGVVPELVEGDGETCWITVADDADAELVRQVVDAHDPTPPAPPPDPDEELAAAIEAATTIEELKHALLGNTRPARVAGRPTEGGP